MRVIINGVDWTDKINPYSIKPYHEKIQGVNQGISMGGSTIFDTIAIKDGFEAMIGLLTQEEYSELMLAAKQDYSLVEYTDPDTDEDLQKNMIITTGRPLQIPLRNGTNVYKNISLNFRER